MNVSVKDTAIKENLERDLLYQKSVVLGVALYTLFAAKKLKYHKENFPFQICPCSNAKFFV